MTAALPLELRIKQLPCWKGEVSLEPLKGGISNSSFTVTDGKEKFVARCGGDIPAHHVFRGVRTRSDGREAWLSCRPPINEAKR